MKRELNIWLDHDTTSEALDILYSVLKSVFKGERTRLVAEHRHVSISKVTENDLELVKKISSEMMIPVICRIEEKIGKKELKKIGFFNLCIEGDCVDMDSDWNVLNSFPEFTCPECKMPDEKKLPDPYYASSKQIIRLEQDDVPDEQLSSKREIFHCHCGVLVIADRMKKILETLSVDFFYSPVTPVPPKKLPFKYWAIHPAHTWGARKNTEIIKANPECGHPVESRISRKKKLKRLWDNRIIMKEASLPETDLFCSMSWQGNRETDPFGFFRDIFISGRLYDLLLSVKIRGLMKPTEFLSLGNMVPLKTTSDSDQWIKSNLALLEKENLL